MKTIIPLSIILLLHLQAFSQANLTFTGGYTFGAVEGGAPKLAGYKISGSYEKVLVNPHWAMGGSFSYMAVSESEGSISTRFRALPLLFMPKFLIGNGKLKGYIKGLAGLQRSRFKFDVAASTGQDWDFGLVFGGGAGANYTINEKVFLNLDYDFLWINNTAYKEISANSISLGVGFGLP